MSDTKLIRGCCKILLPELIERGDKFNAVMIDPPYNVSATGAKIVRGTKGIYLGKDISLDFGEWDKGSLHWLDFIDLIPKLLFDNGVFVMFYDKLELGIVGMYLQEKYKFQVRHIGNWIKSNPSPQARKVRWQNGSESFLIATANTGSGHHFNYKLGQSPDWFMTSVNYEHEHPTQKPLSVMTWLA